MAVQMRACVYFRTVRQSNMHVLQGEENVEKLKRRTYNFLWNFFPTGKIFDKISCCFRTHSIQTNHRTLATKLHSTIRMLNDFVYLYDCNRRTNGCIHIDKRPCTAWHRCLVRFSRRIRTHFAICMKLVLRLIWIFLANMNNNLHWYDPIRLNSKSTVIINYN